MSDLVKVYLKCGLNKKAWTRGRKTDIRANDPACKFWEARSTATPLEPAG